MTGSHRSLPHLKSQEPVHITAFLKVRPLVQSEVSVWSISSHVAFGSPSQHRNKEEEHFKTFPALSRLLLWWFSSIPISAFNPAKWRWTFSFHFLNSGTKPTFCVGYFVQTRIILTLTIPHFLTYIHTASLNPSFPFTVNSLFLFQFFKFYSPFIVSFSKTKPCPYLLYVLNILLNWNSWTSNHQHWDHWTNPFDTNVPGSAEGPEHSQMRCEPQSHISSLLWE